MKPQKTNHAQGLLFEPRLSNLLNPKHELCQLANRIDWTIFEKEFGTLFDDGKSRPPKPVRLMVGLMMLQHVYDLSDEEVVSQWVENPYWQYFCGFDFLQWKFPIDPSSMTRWRQRLGVEGVEKILSGTVRTALKAGVIKERSLESVIVDTTVMEKNIAHPTNAKLYHKAREKLVKLAKVFKIPLRQSYTHVSKKALFALGKYAHARQMKRAKKKEKQIKTFLGRIYREIIRKTKDRKEVKREFQPLLNLVDRLIHQKRDETQKIYSLHEPEVQCIAKGKAHKKYEFGCKVSVVVTHKEGLALNVSALEGNPYDGHTLKQSIQEAESITEVTIKQAFVDKGYRGHTASDKIVYRSGQKRGITESIKRQIKRRQAIEPVIGHMKQDGRLGRNFLKGSFGDKVQALLCGVGHNLRLIVRKLSLQPNYCT